MKFKDRLFAYSIESFGSFDKIPLILFALLRNHPLKKGGIINRIFPLITLRVKSFRGLCITLETHNFSHFVIADEFIDHPIYNLAKVKFNPDYIIDCGAHIGLFTLLARANYSSVPIISFEPLPENIRMIKKQLELNNITDVILEEAAVSTIDGQTIFYIGQASFGGSLQPEENNGKRGQLNVALKDIKKYLLGLSSETKLLLKIDIEGEEENLMPAIISGLPKSCAIFFETHSIEGKEHIYEVLKSHHFLIEENRVIDKYSDHFAIRI